MKILAIETSCDETAAAVIEGSDKTIKLFSNIVSSSLLLHSKTGGIIPEIAAREQVKYIVPVIEQALKESNLYLPSSKTHPQSSTIYRPPIDAIAVTVGPGLIGSLLVGVETAKTLGFVWNKPIIPVNHLIGHIYANWLRADSVEQRELKKPSALGHMPYASIEFPAIALIVSGGHTDLLLMKGHGKIKWLGGTRDDAAGEAFDKIGRLLGLPYPGGPAIAAEAAKLQISNFKYQMFPRPLITEENFDFSFSGLKTAVYREIQKRGGLSEKDTQQIAAETQQAIVDVLVTKTIRAAQKYKVKSILLGGGVAANQLLRDNLQLNAKRSTLNAKIFVPHANLCTDNAAMIAAAAYFNQKETPWQKVTANPELYW